MARTARLRMLVERHLGVALVWLLASTLLVWLPEARAQAVPLDSLVRVHAGAAIVWPVEAPGLTLGMDTRLTRIFSVDALGFVSPLEVGVLELPDGASVRQSYRLRHGVLMAPGLRLPHKQPSAFSWDFLARGGVGAVWLLDLAAAEQGDDGYAATAVPTGFVGADVGLHRGAPGLRISYRQFFLAPFSWEERESVDFSTGQLTVEFLYHFGSE